MKLKGLIISPVLPHPTGQGNRARVFNLSKDLSKFSELDLLFYLYEVVGSTHTSLDRNNEFNDIFRLTFPVAPTVSIQPEPKNNNFHGIDEWWDPALDGTLKYLSANITYDFVLVNYVWLSKALEYFPKSVVKIIDTHDVFTNRNEIYDKIGKRREFFYTNKENEKIGIDRSDFIISLQEADLNFFKSIGTKSEVVNYPHLPSTVELIALAEESSDSVLKIGLLGVNNIVNTNAFSKFIDVLLTLDSFQNIEIYIAGSICDALNYEFENVILLGYVQDLNEFFSKIDIFVNPVELSTGQKIKLADAISYGMPFLSTQNGTEGLPVDSDNHRLRSIEALVMKLRNFQINRSEIDGLAKETITIRNKLNKIRNDGISQIERLILFYRKNIYIFIGSANGFFSDDINLQRSISLYSQIKGVANVFFISDLQRVKENFPDTLSTKEINSLGLEMVDTLIMYGSRNGELELKAKKIVLDKLSFIDNYGKFREKNEGYFSERGFFEDDKCIHLSSIVGISGPRHTKLKDSSILILSSNYEDSYLKIIKNIISKNVLVRLVFPHQIKSYSVNDYIGIIPRITGLIVIDSTDPRYAILIAIATSYGIPIFYLDKFMYQFKDGISIKSIYKLMQLIGYYMQSKSPNMRILNLKNIWNMNPNLWNLLRG